ncbi:MAG: hypothetical protein A2855_01685 [Candidatus Liptonbacteria bacterium RIFCSPHIGHO2_01_FULL_57_28]|uniref:Glycosyltransferase 2-like domain-containing protein n=1 Tax=Candidatus Liptonbacteria bacterium RIFCSPHIGHO2_01_FULL_57_28 TaxID=1798647 RepID=A0A1G2C9W5_9BACT|nr:MAG: hypothetical protein A2855_01685 [Candidatus Liptonbacteria bacterium RIFCSPHIGHO2_01_FULL_57_28]
MARKFSIIVPTYNEEKDIFRTLNALEGLQWPDFEVLIVDDGSKDKTAQIVEQFSKRLPNFRFLPQPMNRGVSAVRNIGIKESQGEVVIILNADVLLPRDFLNRINPYYDQGKKWVAVVARVINLEKVYPRLVEAGSHYTYEVRGDHWVWTEGFSCTKEAAIAVGLFPEAMPGCSGEDADFGLELERKFDGVRAMEVVVPHIAPDNISEFWGQQRGRGQGRTNYYYHMRHLNKAGLFFNSLASSGWRLFKMLILIPLTVRAWQFSKYSEKGRKDFLPFIWGNYVTELAMLAGMWRAFRRILAAKKQ